MERVLVRVREREVEMVEVEVRVLDWRAVRLRGEKSRYVSLGMYDIGIDGDAMRRRSTTPHQ